MLGVLQLLKVPAGHLHNFNKFMLVSDSHKQVTDVHSLLFSVYCYTFAPPTYRG